MKKLKPCPFCGGKASISKSRNRNMNCNGIPIKDIVFPDEFYFIGCETPGCILFVDRENKAASLFFRFYAKDEAIEKWNRRTNNEY